MAIPLLIAPGSRRTAPAGLASQYRPDGAHRPIAAAAALAVVGGVGATLMLALVAPGIVDAPTILQGTNIPLPAPIDPPKVQPLPSPPATSVVTAPTPRFDVPRSSETAIATAPIEATLPSLLPGPTIEFGPPIPAADPPRPPLFVAAVRDPRFAGRFQPAYPPAHERAGVEGRCRVSVTIAATGSVTAVAPVACDDRLFFGSTERQALRSWRFRPATRGGVAVESTQEVGVTFRLPGDER